MPLKRLVKNIPFVYAAALYFKHLLLSGRTKKAWKKYWQESDHPKLQLGAGQNQLQGWFNTDYFPRPGIFFLDVTKRFPFNNDILETVFSEHHIEHITYLQARFMLEEVFRVLKPGGGVKISTPDLEKYIQSYADKSLQSPLVKKHAEQWIYGGFAYASNYIPANGYYAAHFINDIFLNYEHRFIYDIESLLVILKNAGFVNIKRLESFTPAGTPLINIESHTSTFDRLFTLYLYAEKPRHG